MSAAFSKMKYIDGLGMYFECSSKSLTIAIRVTQNWELEFMNYSIFAVLTACFFRRIGTISRYFHHQKLKAGITGEYIY